MVKVTLAGGSEGPVIVVADTVTITSMGTVWANSLGGQMCVGSLSDYATIEVSGQ